MVSLFAFLHHLAAFILVAALAVEFTLTRGELTVQNARTLLRADSIFGSAAGILAAVGLLRVFYFEKGASYYFHSAPFIAKISLFAAVGLMSIYPTVQFLSWRTSLREGVLPATAAARVRGIRAVIRWELAGVALIIFCAVLMARGIGHWGA